MTLINPFYIIIGLVILFIGIYIDDLYYPEIWIGRGELDNDLSNISEEKIPLTAICIRTYNPNEYTLKHMFDFFNSLKDIKELSFHISIDTTTNGDKPGKDIKEYFSKNNVTFLYTIHEYCVTDITNIYDVLKFKEDNDKNSKLADFDDGYINKRGNLINIQTKLNNPKNIKHITWGFHNEPMTLWWNTIKKENNNIKYVWFLEDDVGICGNFRNIINYYSFETNNCIFYNLHIEPKWYWYSGLSNNFIKELKESNISDLIKCFDDNYSVYMGSEHVIRLSTDFLDELHKYSLNGIVGWSECATPTLAYIKYRTPPITLDEQFIYKDTDGKNIYAWNTSMYIEDFNNLNCESSPSCKLLHKIIFNNKPVSNKIIEITPEITTPST